MILNKHDCTNRNWIMQSYILCKAPGRKSEGPGHFW
jgi:hypothetical protein